MKKLGLVLLAAFLLAVSLAMKPSSVYACSCVFPDSAAAAAASSAAVFSGKVTAIKKEKLDGETYNAVLIEVDTAWKGMPYSQAIVYTPWSSCQFDFEIGQSYLLYTYEKQGTLHVISCSRSGLLQHVSADVNELVAGEAPSQVLNLSGEFSMWRTLQPLAVTGAVVMIGAVLLVIIYRRSSAR